MKFFNKRTQAKKIYDDITCDRDMQSMYEYFNNDTLISKSNYSCGSRKGTIMIFHDMSMLNFYQENGRCSGIRCDQDYKTFPPASINLPHCDVVLTR